MPTAAALRALLDDAHKALADGDAAGAEHCARAVSAIVRAEREVAEFAAAAEAQDPKQDEEASRAQLLGRIRRLVEAEHAGAPDAALERIASGAADQ